MALDGFADPWEHLRLLSDVARNDALIGLLERHAPGARVVEIGCGTGLLSVIAARLGAERVYAVEPTPLADVARALVADNDLEGIVEVLDGAIEDLEPRPVDLAFSELLNADPFYEGVVPAMRAARRWAGERGRLAPGRLRVHAALVEAASSAREARMARREVARFGTRFGLRLDALAEGLEPDGPYRYFTSTERPVSSSGLAWDVRLGEDEPDDEVTVEVTVERAGPVAGAIVWFEATYDDDLVLANAPGGEDHWGCLVCAFADERALREGQRVRLTLALDDNEVDVVDLEAL